LRLEMKMTYLFVAHDLQAVAHLCNKIVFLYRGEVVEQLMSADLVNAQNEYAKSLLASVIPFDV
ncbi:ABC transporter ATP-binding protein, partial [Klebsiella pneumoniae]|nr:ABC transporter ATP-binding protein [Klebsiella pneumoniae]